MEKGYKILVLDDDFAQAKSLAFELAKRLERIVSLTDLDYVTDVEHAKRVIDGSTKGYDKFSNVGPVDILVADYSICRDPASKPTPCGHQAAKYALDNDVPVVTLVSSLFNNVSGKEQFREDEIKKVQEEVPGLECFGRDTEGYRALETYLVDKLRE
jgi:hypothetical protein